MAAPSDSDRLRPPQAPGQTVALARVDGRLAAMALWDTLPYWLQAAWRERLDEGLPLARMRAYLRDEASPVALQAAARSPDLPADLRQAAAERLRELALPPTTVAALGVHFKRLVRRPKDALLRHVGSPTKVDPLRDRVDLLAEIIALREAQHDVRAERQVSRAFEGMFQQREAVAVWLLVALCFGLHWLLGALDRSDATAWGRALRLEGGDARPWTYVSYAFVHLTDLRHVLLNMLALMSLGPVLERVLGARRFVVFYLGAAAFGGVLSVAAQAAWGQGFATVGASAALAGLAGLAVTLGIWFSRRYGRIPLRYTARTLGGGLLLLSNFAIGAANGGASVDHFAHLGGLIFGVGAAALLIPGLGRRAAHRFSLSAEAGGLSG